MMQTKLLFLIVVIAVFSACNENESANNSESLGFDKSKVIVLSDSLAYTAIIKNPDPEDEWTTQCLKNINPQELAKVIFDAVYAQKLTAYNYQFSTPMSIQEVKELETEYSRARIAKVLFTEEWYFDKEKLKMYKEVNSIMLAYELYGDSSEVRGYKAGIRVYFNGTEPKQVKSNK
jgi:hypothetical protein